jgi:ubiquinone/menaquinone biosynthesis C-methylase UbiE
MYKQIKDKIFDNPLIFDNIRRILLGGYSHMFSRVKKAVNYKQGDQILDIGCGTGKFSSIFQSGYTGVDAAPNFIKYAKKIYPNHRWYLRKAQDLEFPDKIYDYVLMMNFFHFVKGADRKLVLRNCARLASKKVFIMEPLPNDRKITNFLYRQNRGHQIFGLEKLEREIGEEFEIEEKEVFYSLFYKLVLFTCVPKTTQNL